MRRRTACIVVCEPHLPNYRKVLVGIQDPTLLIVVHAPQQYPFWLLLFLLLWVSQVMQMHVLLEDYADVVYLNGLRYTR
jgi:hypothetical protein